MSKKLKNTPRIKKVVADKVPIHTSIVIEDEGEEEVLSWTERVTHKDSLYQNLFNFLYERDSKDRVGN